MSHGAVRMRRHVRDASHRTGEVDARRVEVVARVLEQQAVRHAVEEEAEALGEVAQVGGLAVEEEEEEEALQ